MEEKRIPYGKEEGEGWEGQEGASAGGAGARERRWKDSTGGEAELRDGTDADDTGSTNCGD